MTFQATSYDAIDEGVYDATLQSIEGGTNDFGEFRKWIFAVQTPDGERTLTAMTSGASGPRSKAYGWASTLLGRKPGADEEELTGHACQLHLVVNEEGYNRVAALLPPAKHQGQDSLNLERLDAKVFAGKAAAVEIPF